MDNDKQSQRIFINEAIKDFLSRGGTIKKVNLKETTAEFKETGYGDDFINISESYSQEPSGFFPLTKRFEVDDTW